LNEDVLRHAKDAFIETIALKVKHLRHYVKKNTNSDLTGLYIEEVVRGFVKNWIGHRVLINGTFYSSEFENSEENPLQIDSIIYDPTMGPPVMLEGNFGIVHPVFCAGVLEIKTSYSGSLLKFQERLDKIHRLYMHHVRKSQVMGVVICDSNPDAKSTISTKGENFKAFSYNQDWCPIFVLFEEKDGEYQPFEPAIDAIFRAIFTNLWTNPNTFWLNK
jgi:hypothetical protein